MERFRDLKYVAEIFSAGVAAGLLIEGIINMSTGIAANDDRLITAGFLRVIGGLSVLAVDSEAARHN